jgi:alkaline phosphatase D
VEKFDAPHFKSFISQGTSAEGLIPSFPSKTFPNHYSIITGLYPGHHGLIDNQFYDPDRKEFYEMKNSQVVKDPYYYEGTPLWKLAHDQGVKSASFFWVGSEVPQPGLLPNYYFAYDQSFPDTARIEQIVRWLKLPEPERPHFITLYFSSPDHEGHTFGPSTKETRDAVLNCDRLLDKLQRALQKHNLAVNVILVSDHGMEELEAEPDTYIFLDELMNRKDTAVKVANGGTQAHVYVNDQAKLDSLHTSLASMSQKFTVYEGNEFPARWHYESARAGDLLITAHPGYYIIDQERKKFLSSIQPGKRFGVHGYDPHDVKNMRGIFYAKGPNIKKGLQIPAFENVHIYPMIAFILGLTTPTIDGDQAVLKDIVLRR